MSFAVSVDPTNPGQFFACCGLLELADRLWPASGAEGWFAADGRTFQVECDGLLRMLLSVLVMDPPEAVARLDNGLEVAPLLAPLRFSFDGGATTAITLDAWTRIGIAKKGEHKGKLAVVDNRPWNFWSGQQTSLKIWQGLRAELAAQLRRLPETDWERLFAQTVFQGGRFGFDPGPAWTALDVGFSPNEHNMEVESSPAVELLAAVGIQRCRPPVARDAESLVYHTWHTPLSPAVAAAAMAGGLSGLRRTKYLGRVADRGNYAALTYAHQTPEDSPNG